MKTRWRAGECRSGSRASVPRTRCTPLLQRAATVLCFLVAGILLAPSLSAQATARQAALDLDFDEVRFDPPQVARHDVGGVRVLYLADPSLPLVNVFARFKGGYAYFARDLYAAGTALPGMIRAGGSLTVPPDSVDELQEFFAIQSGFGTSGGSSFSNLNTLTEHLDTAMVMWTDLLRHPRFDSAQLEVWRGQELESVRRRFDDPARLAFSEFNRIMFGDHPIGWEMIEADLSPERLNVDALERVHREVFCRDNLILGITGDVTWEEMEPRLERMLEGWPDCPSELQRPSPPDIRTDARIFLIPKELEQSTVVLAQASEIRQGNSPSYFASRVANSILGASGFSSRLMSQLRTEHGYAYSASSFWTAPIRSGGIVGALTRTGSDTTIEAVELIREIVGDMVAEPPTQQEVQRTVDELVNGFVFNFESPSQIVSRQMLYLAQDMPEDWLQSFLRGIQRVSADDVHQVMRDNVRPDALTILIVGDPEAFGRSLEELGPVEIWQPESEQDPLPPRG